MIKKGNKVLITMLVATLIALGFGFFVMNQRVSSPPVTSFDDSELETVTPPPTPSTEPEEIEPVSTTGWKVYENDKHGFSLRYPTNQKAGSVSGNSVLGTADAPVRGFHVGPLVLVVLKDATLKKEAQEYFNTTYNVALNPPSGEGQEIPPIECTIHKITNTKVEGLRSVACNGEGGPAKYAYIEGASYDVFVDGYSKGYDGSDNGNYTSDADYITVLSTFSFSADAAVTPGTTTLASSTTAENKNPTFQSFTITADDAGANPSEITVTKDAIVQITFTVGANVQQGSMEFKSSVVNSGSIAANQSKTISFKATDSFSFVTKNYTIKVVVQ